MDILDIEIIRAWSVWIPGYGPFGDHTEEPDVFEVKIEEIENGRIIPVGLCSTLFRARNQGESRKDI